MQLILISGFAGAGKSTALKILEDVGFFCIDNLPPPLLMQLVDIYSLPNNSNRVAVSIDTRSQVLLEELPTLIDQLDEMKVEHKVIFLKARPDILIKRFSETRRRHPLGTETKTISDCIIEEEEMLSPISEIAHSIDTSDMKANDLKNLIKQFVNADYSQLNIVLQSFGFKYGLPLDSDYVFDVRFLPNPYYNDSLRDFSGLEIQVIEFLDKEKIVQDLIKDIFNLIQKWLPNFNLENRHYLTISIGCTGGKHRSVYIANKLASLLNQDNYKTLVRHRHLPPYEK